jgi:hypothetical protein
MELAPNKVNAAIPEVSPTKPPQSSTGGEKSIIDANGDEEANGRRNVYTNYGDDLMHLLDPKRGRKVVLQTLEAVKARKNRFAKKVGNLIESILQEMNSRHTLEKCPLILTDVLSHFPEGKSLLHKAIQVSEKDV